MKKFFDIIWGGTIIVLAVILISFCALLFVPQIVNDAALPPFREEVIENLTLPEKSEMIEYVSGCGNTSGTGDHTELYVAVLIKSSLTLEELKAYYARESNTYVHDCSGFEAMPVGMMAINAEFETDIEKAEGYYILEYRKSAPLSWLDIRGM